MSKLYLDIVAFRGDEFINTKTIHLKHLSKLNKITPSLPGKVLYDLKKKRKAVWDQGDQRLEFEIFEDDGKGEAP